MASFTKTVQVRAFHFTGQRLVDWKMQELINEELGFDFSIGSIHTESAPGSRIPETIRVYQETCGDCHNNSVHELNRGDWLVADSTSYNGYRVMTEAKFKAWLTA